MSDTVYTVNSQAEWEAGDTLDGVVALDPAGKLNAAISSYDVASLMLDSTLCVFWRCYEGAGTEIHNVGVAGSGTLANIAAWKTRNDDRHYLSGYATTLGYHASFQTVDESGKSHGVSGGCVVRFSSITARTVMSLTNRFTLEIDASGYPYATYKDAGGTWRQAKSTTALEANVWYELGFVAGSGYLYLYVNAERKAVTSGFTGYNGPGAGTLTVGGTGMDYTSVVMFGDGSDVTTLLRQSTGGYWEKVYNLGSRKTLRHIVVDSAIGDEHSGSVAVTFADSEAELPYQAGYTFRLEDQPAWSYWPAERGMKAGTYALVRVYLSAQSWHRDLPYLDYFTVTFRDCVAAQYDFVALTQEASYPEVFPPPEVGHAEDLTSLLAELKKLQENVTEVHRVTRSYISVTHKNTRRIETLERTGGIEHRTKRTGEQYLAWMESPATIKNVDYQAIRLRLGRAEANVRTLLTDVSALRTRVGEIEEDYVITADLTSAIEDHDDSSSAHTGTGKVMTLHLANSDAHRFYYEQAAAAFALDAVQTHEAASDPHDGSPSGAHYAKDSELAAHTGDQSDVHGCDGSPIGSTDLMGYFASHVGASDPHPGYCLESASYATESWVTSKGYQTAAQVASIANSKVGDHEALCGNFTG